MAFTPVETIALVMIVGGLIKIAVLLVNPKSWMNFAKDLYSKPKAVSAIALIFAAIVFYYIIQEVSIVQILAVTAFVALLILVGMANHVGSIMKQFEVIIKKGNLWRDYWLYTLIWVILLAWGAKELFF